MQNVATRQPCGTVSLWLCRRATRRSRAAVSSRDDTTVQDCLIEGDRMVGTTVFLGHSVYRVPILNDRQKALITLADNIKSSRRGRRGRQHSIVNYHHKLKYANTVVKIRMMAARPTENHIANEGQTYFSVAPHIG